MTKKRRAFLLALSVIAAGCIAFLIYTVHWKFLSETGAIGVSGRAGEATEQSLREELAPELAALDAAGITYRLKYDTSEQESRGEVFLWITVPAYKVDLVQDTVSYALYGVPDAKLDGHPALPGPDAE